jgi:hypothetical protein
MPRLKQCRRKSEDVKEIFAVLVSLDPPTAYKGRADSIAVRSMSLEVVKTSYIHHINELSSNSAQPLDASD